MRQARCEAVSDERSRLEIVYDDRIARLKTALETGMPADIAINADTKLSFEMDALRQQHRGSMSLTDDEIQCLTCAMAGNFPERFEPIRADLLRKLFKAYPYRCD